MSAAGESARREPSLWACWGVMDIRVARLARRLISERHIAIRSKGRIRYLTLTRSWQVAGLCILLVGASAMARLTVGYIASDRKAAHRAAEVAQAEMSNDQLRELVGRLQDQLAVALHDAGRMRARLATVMSQNAAIRNDLYAMEARLRSAEEARAGLLAERDSARERLAAAEAAIAAKSAQIARMSHSLDGTKSDLKQTEQQRAGLTSRIHELAAELQAASAQAAQSKAAAEAAERKLRQMTAEHEKLLGERGGLAGKLAALEPPRLEAEKPEKLALAEPALADQRGAAGAGATGFGYLENETRRGWGELMRVLASAGVDLDKLAARYGAVPPGQGGPFVALGAIKQGAGLSEGMRKMLRALPLSAPLAQYQLESRFGPRVDPFNHRQSMHTGLDFAAPFKSPVYNTAPGVVVFAGVKHEYGKVVEIDHGSGIVTRYAHLHRITVALGQRLTAREQIGLLGSTGRSTGPHVHYEVLVNGTPQDPEKFLDAGKRIIQAAGN
ncbi:MAG TPA: M23 family metallopeptidase [Stellaceae bacterium]|nr:M23 family metallopeptidase [Stellaceae bacterium]